MFLFGLDKAAESLPMMVKGCLAVASKALQHTAQLSGRHFANYLLLQHHHYMVVLHTSNVRVAE